MLELMLDSCKLRVEEREPMVDAHKKNGAAIAVLEERVQTLAGLGMKMGEVIVGVRNCTEEFFQEAKIAFITESQRTMSLVPKFRLKRGG